MLQADSRCILLLLFNIPSPLNSFLSIFEPVCWACLVRSLIIYWPIGFIASIQEKTWCLCFNQTLVFLVAATSHFSLKCIRWTEILFIVLFFHLTVFAAVGLCLKADSIWWYCIRFYLLNSSAAGHFEYLNERYFYLLQEHARLCFFSTLTMFKNLHIFNFNGLKKTTTHFCPETLPLTNEHLLKIWCSWTLMDCSLLHMDFACSFCFQQICQHDDPQDDSHQSDWLETNTEHQRGRIQLSAHKRSDEGWNMRTHRS